MPKLNNQKIDFEVVMSHKKTDRWQTMIISAMNETIANSKAQKIYGNDFHIHDIHEK